MMTDLPKKLRRDAIIEAIIELRFTCDELEDLVAGRLVDGERWKGYNPARLPAADMPALVREMEPSLRYMPTIELKHPFELRALKIGPHVASYHALAPYPGWSIYEPEIHDIVEQLFSRFASVSIDRVGLRYINALTKDDHKIGRFGDLNVSLSVGGQEIERGCMVLYQIRPDDETNVVVRIATRDFIQVETETSLDVLADIDVSTPDGVSFSQPSAVYAWISKAHVALKTEFFKVLPEDVISALRED